jgi:hypothetical protein
VSSPRPCSDISDGFCPAACMPCSGSCGPGQDTDCPRTNGSPCLANGECVSNFCVDGYCCNALCDLPCDRCNQAGSLGMCVYSAQGTIPAAPSCAGFTVCSGSWPYCPSLTSCSTTADCRPGYNCRVYNSNLICQGCNPTGVACTPSQAPGCCTSVCSAAGFCT